VPFYFEVLRCCFEILGHKAIVIQSNIAIGLKKLDGIDAVDLYVTESDPKTKE
jgi:hypothetical protein